MMKGKDCLNIQMRNTFLLGYIPGHILNNNTITNNCTANGSSVYVGNTHCLQGIVDTTEYVKKNSPAGNMVRRIETAVIVFLRYSQD